MDSGEESGEAGKGTTAGEREADFFAGNPFEKQRAIRKLKRALFLEKKQECTKKGA